MLHRTFLSFVIILGFAACTLPVSAQTMQTVLTVPGRDQFTHIDTAGISVLPSGRFLTPAGQLLRITHDPFGMAVSPDGKKAVTLHNGVFSIIDIPSVTAVRVPSYDGKIASPLSDGSFLGVCFAADSKTVFLSGGDNGAVIVYDIEAMKRIDSISLDGKIGDSTYSESFTSDLQLIPGQNELLVLDRGNFRMVTIDLTTRKLKATIPVGRQPFGLAISPDKKLAFVANVGLYDYPLLPDLTKENYNQGLLPHHPYGNNTKESIEGYEKDGRKIPGVGSPLAPEAMSVYTVDLLSNKVIARFKPGYQIGELVEDAEVIGGASPNSIAVGSRYAYVTNATNDNIAVIDYQKHEILKHIQLKVDPAIDKYRGLLPFGITLSKDEKTLYVALLGFNAIAVVDAISGTMKGLIPTGWGPARVLLSNDEREIYVITCRGLGAGPNGGKEFVRPEQGTYIGDIQLGSFQKIPMPDAAALASYTKKVLGNTFTRQQVARVPGFPVPVLPNRSTKPGKTTAPASPIKYIVYITKENRTYDEIFGQLKQAKGDESLARYGNNVTVMRKKDTIHNANVMPNHLKAAVQFAFSDNFYCDSDASIHGHHWMMGVIPNEWVETNSSADATFNAFSKAPGRRFPRSTGSMDPEDYSEIGGLWEALDRKKIDFYNFGEANETGSVREEWMDTATGAAHGIMVPMQKALFHRTSHNYAGFNTNIPDQFRLEQFETEFTKLFLKGKKKMPSLITIQLPNDHSAGDRPEDGYHSSHSFMADNDLALGRMLHFLSRTPYWKNMLVIITEDDPQGGVDHVDAHRSVLMMAGPYVKRNYVSHTHANFGSILRLIYTILGVPPVNQYDATASLLLDFFTAKPDFTPYSLVMPDKRVFDPEQSMKRYHRGIDWRKIMKGPEMDDEDDMKRDHYQQHGK